jgi:hypothetical protein
VSPRIAIAAALAATVLAAPAAAAPQKCNGMAALCARTFDQVVLAGTHNSMSSATDQFSVPNQQVGIPAQLKLGIRGFLIVTYMAHRQPDGTVVPDDTPTAASRVYLCHIACGAAGATLFAKALKQVVITAESNAAGAPWYHPAYAGIVQETPYAWPQESALTDPLQQPSSCVPNRGGTTGSLFLMNHWSPPFGANPEAGARVNAKDAIISRARTCASQRGKVPTLIAVDMVGSGDVIGAVRELNASPPPTTPAA